MIGFKSDADLFQLNAEERKPQLKSTIVYIWLPVEAVSLKQIMNIRGKYIIKSAVWILKLKCQKKSQVDLSSNIWCSMGVEQTIFFRAEKWCGSKFAVISLSFLLELLGIVNLQLSLCKALSVLPRELISGVSEQLICFLTVSSDTVGDNALYCAVCCHSYQWHPRRKINSGF